MVKISYFVSILQFVEFYSNIPLLFLAKLCFFQAHPSNFNLENIASYCGKCCQLELQICRFCFSVPQLYITGLKT